MIKQNKSTEFDQSPVKKESQKLLNCDSEIQSSSNQYIIGPKYSQSSPKLTSKKELEMNGDEKDKYIEKLKSLNDQLKEKVVKLSQALDISLSNNQKTLILSNPPPQTQDIQQLNQQQNQVQTVQREVLANHLKQKDKEIAAYINQIQGLKKENHQLKIRVENKEGFQRIVDLEDQLRIYTQRNQELQKEVKNLQRIQQDQGKALEKITNENDYPNRIKALVEELRIARDKIRELEEKSRREERNSMQIQEYMVRLEETCRDLKSKLKNRQGSMTQNMSTILTPSGDNSILIDNGLNRLGMSDMKIEELQKANVILMKAKEVQYKKGQYLKVKFEKKFQRFKNQIESLQQQITDKDKPLKPGGVRTIKLQQLSIDVNSNDYGINGTEMITGKSQRSIGAAKSVSNRSKSIDPTSKRLAKLPETTKKLSKPISILGPENAESSRNIGHEEAKTEIKITTDDISYSPDGVYRQESAQTTIVKPNSYKILDEADNQMDYLTLKQKQIEQQTDELLERITQQREQYYLNQDKLIDDGLDFHYTLDGDISKLNSNL